MNGNYYTVTVTKAATERVIWWAKTSYGTVEGALAECRVVVDAYTRADGDYDIRLADRWGNEIGNWSV